MIWIMLTLCFLGFVFMMMEVILPHGISFALGGMLIALGIYLVWREDPQTGMMAMGVALPLSGLAAWWVFRSGIKLMALKPATPDLTGEPVDPAAGELVTVTQPLRPTGTVRWGERRLTARTLQSEIEIPIGQQVRVCGRDSIYLLVEPMEDGPNAAAPPASADK